MATNKRRVSLYLSKDLAERGMAAANRLPNYSLSQAVEEYLSQMVPILEELADAVEEENPTRARQFMANRLGDALLHIALGEEEEHT